MTTIAITTENSGEVASQLAVDIIYDRLSEAKPPRNREDLARRLVRAVQDAGLRIFSEARADRSRRGMGTTSTIARRANCSACIRASR